MQGAGCHFTGARERPGSALGYVHRGICLGPLGGYTTHTAAQSHSQPGPSASSALPSVPLLRPSYRKGCCRAAGEKKMMASPVVNSPHSFLSEK